LLCSCEERFAYGVAIESVRRYIGASLVCLMIALCDVCTSCWHAVHSSDMCYAAIAVCAQTSFRHRSYWLAREFERGGERQFVRQTPLVIIKCIARSHARANACHTHGTPHRADISTSSVVRLRVYVDDRDATDATQRTVSDAECVARAVRPFISRVSNFSQFYSRGYT